MKKIGVELICKQVVNILPGDWFTMVLTDKNKRIMASFGKDVYHDGVLLMSNRRIAATGRISHYKRRSFLMDDRVSPYFPIPYPDLSHDLGVLVTFSRESYAELLHHFAVLLHDGERDREVWFDENYSCVGQSNQLYFKL